MQLLRTPALILLMAAVVLMGILLFHKKISPAHACAQTAPRIIAFGDSLVAGYGATTQGGFVTLLSQKEGVPIENLGVIGDTTADAKGRLDLILALKPDITLVLLGGNDALQQVQHAQTEQNLADIITALQQNGSKVILLGAPGSFPVDPYAPMFEDLAKTYKVTYVPNVLLGILGRSSLTIEDDVHPNEAGYQMIADRVLPVLEKECSK